MRKKIIDLLNYNVWQQNLLRGTHNSNPKFLNRKYNKSKQPIDLNHINYISLSKNYQKSKVLFSTKPAIHIGGDFEKLVTESTIFIDKSLFIKEIIEDKSEVILITMPRRWGKSLNLDIIRRFLSVEEQNPKQKTSNDKIFSQQIKRVSKTEKNYLDIVSEKVLQSDEENMGVVKKVDIMAIQGQYPVIFIDFKDCKGMSVEDIKTKLKDKIIKTIEQFGYLALSTKPYKNKTIGESYSKLVGSISVLHDSFFSTAIKELSALLHIYHNKKVWILIDEYDAAVNKAYLEFKAEDASQVANLFKEVYESALKDNSENLEKGVLTGVQYLVISGMLFGLNNLSKYNITSTKYAKYYGLSKTEMKLLLKHFEIEEKELKIKDWYNGYKLNTGTVENPKFEDRHNIWSVVNYLNNQAEGFKSYWENNSLDELINKSILQNPAIKNIVENLINNNNLVLNSLTSDFSVSDFKILKSIIENYDPTAIKQDGIDLLFSYLFITGYLTNASIVNEYRIPNKEIKTAFETKLVNYYNQIFCISPPNLNELTKIINRVFLEEDARNIAAIFKESFAPKLSLLINKLKLYSKNTDAEAKKELFANEDLMHSLLNNIAIGVVNIQFASERHITKTNKEQGRADIVLSKHNKVIAIEIKYNAIDPKLALMQAKDHAELIKNAEIKIFIGCNINQHQEIFLSGDIINGNDEPIHFDYP